MGAYASLEKPHLTRRFPKGKGGDIKPDTELWAHTQLGRNKIDDPSARTWLPKEGGGVQAAWDYEFTDHNWPLGHPNPHVHRLEPNNPKIHPRGGYRRVEDEIYTGHWPPRIWTPKKTRPWWKKPINWWPR